jgi:hypothetical protein
VSTATMVGQRNEQNRTTTEVMKEATMAAQYRERAGKE